SGVTSEGLIAAMNARLTEIPGVDFNFSQPIKDNIEENISGLKGQLAVKVFGDDLEGLHRAAADVKRVLEGVRGVADLAVVQAAELPQVHIRVDRQAVARYGLNVGDVEDVVETAIGVKPATTLWEGERHFDVVVRLAEAARATLDRIPDVRVTTPDGAQVPLAQLAHIEVAPGQAAISREANMRFVGIKCNVRGRDLGGFVKEAQRKVAERVQLPPNAFITWGGEFENQRRAMARLAFIIPLSIVLILVMLVSQINALRVEGMSLRAAVEAGAARRLRAVLMTALLAALGLLPAALSTQIGSETQRPLAVVVIGGLVSATLLTLLVLPVLYTLVLSERGVRDVPRVLRRRDEALPAAEVA